MPEAQWIEFEDWQEANEMAIEHSSCKGKGKALPTFGPELVLDTSSATTIVPPPLFDSDLAPPDTSSAASQVITTGTSIKQTHECTISSTSGTVSLPHKFSVPHNPPPALLCSPDHNDLKVALEIGGGADLDFGHETGLSPQRIIDGGDESFIKYIYNMDPDPLRVPDEFGYDFTLFLAFTQHVQYITMGGLVFISDYQESHPSVSDSKDIFGGGGGNIEKAVILVTSSTQKELKEWLKP
ncbi:uncharacterized protein F5147DRAFT_660141 [Suillus discolor]|uniref:Uncharacterized protein n=1 Tax=Suillus discolor TaxID=1912936 RepID=A0A9P7ERZ9_9AGAM|nr:uncharacterized protein F5147DRAFT_660141 [Suillus discolor]KAG2083565.1 hypothetical protein F5147DRAFT_660141 [Suillus discolor]